MRYDDLAMRTRTAARVLGPYFCLMAATLLVRQSELTKAFLAFMQDAPLVLATGALTLIAALALIAMHHHWKGPAAVAVSLIGITAALKGAMLLIVPGFGADMTAAIMRVPQVFTISAGAMLVVGLWLSFVGWRPNA